MGYFYSVAIQSPHLMLFAQTHLKKALLSGTGIHRVFGIYSPRARWAAYFDLAAGQADRQFWALKSNSRIVMHICIAPAAYDATHT
jgi:hypothetical protein